MKKLFTSFLVLTFICGVARAQMMYQPYSYQFYQKLNASVYATDNYEHTSLKPFLLTKTGITRPLYDSLLQLNVDNSKKSWLDHLLFSGHLAAVNTKEYTFSLDYLTDLQLGRDLEQPKTIDLNTRGYQLYGTIGNNFFFYTSGYENQGRFANYETAYIGNTGMVPGQAYNKSGSITSPDWSYVTALIGYKLNKAVTLELGEDKTFIGDGYRSVLLSDYAAPYPLLRLRVDFGKNVEYMAMWAYLEDQSATNFDAFTNIRRKWAGFHYLDWNISSRASIGFFNAVISEEANNQGQLHGFDVNYIDPVYFASSIGPANPVPDHTLLGFNAKYKVFNKLAIYAQYLVDQASSPGNNSSRNSWQLGIRGADLFAVKNFNYLVEYNTSTPYTYANQYPIVNYAQYNEPLADPLGANFKEFVGILNYSIGKFDLQGQINYANYGTSTKALNYGNDIRQSDNTNLPATIGSTGQGVANTLKYAEGTVAYLLNPKYNLRIEVGGLLRQQTSIGTDNKTFMLTFGLRSSFRDLYHDF